MSVDKKFIRILIFEMVHVLKQPLGILRIGWADNRKMCPREVDCEDGRRGGLWY
jgi:hypothetical protein